MELGSARATIGEKSRRKETYRHGFYSAFVIRCRNSNTRKAKLVRTDTPHLTPCNTCTTCMCFTLYNFTPNRLRVAERHTVLLLASVSLLLVRHR